MMPSVDSPESELQERGEVGHGLTMRDIGLRCGINETRVSQIHKRALTLLAVVLRELGITGSASVLPA